MAAAMAWAVVGLGCAGFAQAAQPGLPAAPGNGRSAAPAAAAARPTGGKVTLTSIVPDGKVHKFEMKNKQFLIDDQPTLLIAAEMHFGRVLPEDFELRVKQAKAMGINVLSFYLFWNLSEPEEGKFDFTGMNDVRRMFKICQENGMWVVLRPGPYCCAEVDYGGIPYWTLKKPGVKIRTMDPTYVEWSKRYIERVEKEVDDQQVTKGGPLLMVQVENEYAMVAGGNYEYPKALGKIFKEAGFQVPLFVCDPGSFSRGGVNPYGDDLMRGRNGLNGEGAYQQAAAAAGDFPVYSPEVYTAWFSGWGQPIATRNSSIKAISDWTNFLLDHDASWCYFLVFGGTNWGYNSGCNEWLPLQTTYDYSAPVDEAGRITPKYRALREILARRTGRELPPVPADPAVGTLPTIKLTETEKLLEMVKGMKPTVVAAKPATMEEMGQAFGFALYRKQFPQGIHGKLELKEPMDYAVTMVNGKTVGKSFVGLGPQSDVINVDEAGPATLDILVHNLGRISVIVNAAAEKRAHKGLIGGATLDGQELTEWESYSLPLTTDKEFKATGSGHGGPTFYHGTFTVEQPVSTFLDMRNWGMGVVWVNGHNLGRHWDRGGARALFLSEHFLRPGNNEITVLELHDAPKAAEVASSVKMIEEPAVPFPVRLDRSVLAPPAPQR
jgi:beta-galactosidase